MEKTEMMKRYEKETGMCCAYDTLFEWDFSLTDNYIAWLEAKAEAYDRLTSKEPCEFCVNNSTKELEHNGFKMTCYSTHYGYAELQVESPEHDGTGDFEINYCPMCGRNLGGADGKD